MQNRCLKKTRRWSWINIFVNIQCKFYQINQLFHFFCWKCFLDDDCGKRAKRKIMKIGLGTWKKKRFLWKCRLAVYQLIKSNYRTGQILMKMTRSELCWSVRNLTESGQFYSKYFEYTFENCLAYRWLKSFRQLIFILGIKLIMNYGVWTLLLRLKR